MKSPKVWKSFEDQLMLLEDRGLKFQNQKRALSYLERIGYYRLSGYWYPFKQKDVSGKCLDEFILDSYFEEALDLYVFDKRLRLLALDALERIEIAIRVDVAHLLGKKESLAHMNPSRFDGSFKHKDWTTKYDNLINFAKNAEFVVHHKNYYGGKLPIWVASEVWDFGALSKLYAGMKYEDKDKIARKYKLPSGAHLESQLRAFNFIRNVSAHHGRLWNRSVIGRASLKGLRDSELRKLSTNQMFVYFCLMKRMLDIICPRSTWGKRFLSLINEFPKSCSGAIAINQFGLSKQIDLQNWKLWNTK